MVYYLFYLAAVAAQPQGGTLLSVGNFADRGSCEDVRDQFRQTWPKLQMRCVAVVNAPAPGTPAPPKPPEANAAPK